MQVIWRKREWISGLAVLLLAACDAPVQQEAPPGRDPYAEQFVKTNKYLQRRHQDHISAFVERVGWDAETTPSGLWIVVEHPGSGPGIREGSRVTYAFTSKQLDGTPCYQATGRDPKVVVIGAGGIISGVAEGLSRLREGAKAVFLIPPHLGHGNFGDRNKIPGNTVLLYRVTILDVDPGL